jgi:hypothetical protein
MAYLITTMLYPPSKIEEVTQCFLDAISKYPPDPKLGKYAVRVATRQTLEGIKVLTIREVSKENMADTLEYQSRFVGMYRKVEGLRCSIEVYSTADEAYDSVGLSKPKELK